jgi:periplasmic divalent cation tolerance protein
MTPADHLIALVTCPPEKAESLAAALVESRNAACVNIVPGLRSVYRWKDAVQQDDETLLIIKTTAAHFQTLKETVLKLHPYELPEVIAVKVEAGHAPYLDWITQSLR